MKTLEKIGAFILRHWRYVILVICLVTFAISDATFWQALKGMAVVGFIWSVYGIWSNHQNNLKV